MLSGQRMAQSYSLRTLIRVMKIYPVIMAGVCLLSFQDAVGGNWQVIPSANGTNKVNELHGVSALADNERKLP